MLKKFLALALACVPVAAAAGQPLGTPGYIVGTGIPGMGPSAPVVGGDCFVIAGVLSCVPGTLNPNSDFVNPGNIASGEPGIYGDLSYAGWADQAGAPIDPITSVNITGSLKNENLLILAPGSSASIAVPDGTIYIGGYVYNGTLDGATFDDNPADGGTVAVTKSRLILEGGSITIAGKDSNDVAVLNAGEKAIAGLGLEIDPTGCSGGPCYAHTTATAADSLSIKANFGPVVIGGHIWNNTIDGVTGRVGADANSVRIGIESEQNVQIAGDFINFGGWANISAGTDLLIVGEILSGFGTMALETTNGQINVGSVTLDGAATNITMTAGGTGGSSGIVMGSLLLDSGYGAFVSDTFITVNGAITVNSAGTGIGTNFAANGGMFMAMGGITNAATAGDFSISATNGISVAGNISNSVGLMYLNAGSGTSRQMTATGLMSNFGGTVVLDYVSNLVLNGTTTALSVAGSMYVGITAVGGSVGDMFFAPTAGAYNMVTGLIENYITSRGSINVAGNVAIASGYGLYINAPSTNYINVTLGDVSNGGLLALSTFAATVPASGYGVRSFIAGDLMSVGTLTAPASVSVYISDDASGMNTISLGVVENRAYSSAYFQAPDDITMLSFSNFDQTSSDATIWSKNGDITMTGGINSGFIENRAIGTAQMVVQADNGAITTASYIENSGTYLQLLATNGITVGDTMKNDWLGGMGILLVGTDGVFDSQGNLADANAVASLTINGGDAVNASIVNTGIFKAVVLGDTYLAYGIDLSTTENNSVFYLDTGTFTLGNNPNGTNGMNDLMANRIGSFTLKVQDGDLDVTDVINGAKKLPVWNGTAYDYSDPGIQANATANMYVSAQNITATSVTNIGQNLTLVSTDITTPALGVNGNLWIQTNVFSGTADGQNAIDNGQTATTILQAAGILAIDGSAHNLATLSINGQRQVIMHAINNFGKMSVTSLTNIGVIDINGNVINTGPTGTVGTSYWGTGAAYDLFVNAKQVNINGDYLNTSGTALIKASDGGAITVGMQNVTVTGGQLDIDALNGVAMNGALSVSGGLLNLSGNTNLVTMTGNMSISGSVNSQSTYNLTTGSVNVLGNSTILATLGGITIGGDVLVAAGGTLQELTLVSPSTISIVGNAIASGSGVLAFGAVSGPATGQATVLTVGGQMQTTAGAKIVLYADNTTVATLLNNGKIEAHGVGLTATAAGVDAITITGGVSMIGSTGPAFGFVIGGDTTDYTLQTTGAGANINVVGGINVSGVPNILTMISANRLLISGDVVNSLATLNLIALADVLINGDIVSDYATNITGNGIVGGNITNSGNFNITSTGGLISLGNILNNVGALMNLGSSSYPSVSSSVAGITQTGGVMNIYGMNSTVTNSLLALGGAVNLYARTLFVGSTIFVNGDMVQGATTGNFNVLYADASVIADSLNVGGDLNAIGNSATYTISGVTTIDDSFNVQNGATVNLLSSSIFVDGMNVGTGMASVLNAGTLTMNALYGAIMIASDNGVTNYSTGNMTVIGNSVYLGLVQNYGIMSVNSGTVNALNVSGLNTYSGGLTLNGIGATSSGAWNIAGQLTQNAASAGIGGVNILAGNYVIDMTDGGISPNSISIGNGIVQNTGLLTIMTSSLTIGLGGIDASTGGGVTIAGGTSCFGSGCTPPVGVNSGDWFPWLSADITGSISDGVKFFGLGNMNVTGNYNFGDRSVLHVNVLPQNFDPARNHYGTISLNDATFGTVDITGAKPIINITGSFVSDLSGTPALGGGGMMLGDAQIGAAIFDSVNSGSLIWLAHADNGVVQSGAKLRNVSVSFCNADGTKCFNYLDAIRNSDGTLYSKTPLVGTDDASKLPIYLMMGDSAGIGMIDNIYIVFNPEFGGPINVYRVQPIVEKDPTHTQTEYESAGALDDLIDGGLHGAGFFNTTPIEAIPFVFNGTIFQEMSEQLYQRMEQYRMDFNREPLSRFSRLFVPRELEMLTADVSLATRTNANLIASRMVDEFLWNRNRNLTKLWADFEASVFNQNGTDDVDIDGRKLTLHVGLDHQFTEHTIFGLAARVGKTDSSLSDRMDLGFGGPNGAAHIPGSMDIDVSNLNVGIGGYFLTTFSRELRLSGNVFLDMHMLDVSRDQTYMGQIGGSGTAYSVTGEIGLLHDLLNHYLVGNMYVRLGYNTGFDITEKVAGEDYMKLRHDGYFMVSPGYSIMATKRFYMTPWLQLRPHASVGVEYDVLGMDKIATYKFEPAESYTEYNLDVKPLWLSGKIGAEVLAVGGWQIGFDYEYKHNEIIRLHNFRFSGSWRF